MKGPVMTILEIILGNGEDAQNAKCSFKSRKDVIISAADALTSSAMSALGIGTKVITNVYKA